VRRKANGLKRSSVRFWPDLQMQTGGIADVSGVSYLGLARNIYIHGVYTRGVLGRGITKYTVMYGVYIRFWLTLFISK
jgi:hypothetical protein